MPEAKAVRMGGDVFMSRGEGCPVAFENISVQQAVMRYEPIGIVTMRSEVFDQEARAELENEACSLGAHVVTLGAAVKEGNVETLQFFAWRRRATSGM